MSNFKDAVKRDIHSVFINVDEFADTHAINGRQVKCVVDTDVTDEATGKGSVTFEGVFVNMLTIYVATADLEFRPVEGELLDLDDETYIVRKVSDEYGVLVILAEVNAQ